MTLPRFFLPPIRNIQTPHDSNTHFESSTIIGPLIFQTWAVTKSGRRACREMPTDKWRTTVEVRMGMAGLSAVSVSFNGRPDGCAHLDVWSPRPRSARTFATVDGGQPTKFWRHCRQLSNQISRVTVTAHVLIMVNFVRFFLVYFLYGRI